MGANRFSVILKGAIIAGLIAGLAMGLFHFLVTERLIDQAIALEEAGHSGGEAHATIAVSREAQKGILVFGSGLYGLIVGAIFAFVFAVLERRLPGKHSGIKAALLAGAMWWFFGLMVQLKYSATLPGVGDPDTAIYRQWLQIGFLALSILAAAITWAAYRLLGKTAGTNGRMLRLSISALLYIALTALIFRLMPNNPPPSPELASMSEVFRVLSISGHALFWGTLGGVLAVVLKRREKEEAFSTARAVA